MGVACTSCTLAEKKLSVNTDLLIPSDNPHDEGKSNKNSDDLPADGKPLPAPILRLRKLLKKSYKCPMDAFVALDSDGDAHLDVEELRSMLSKIGVDGKWTKEDIELLDSSISVVFGELDVNKDGKLTAKEFKAGLGARMK
eukprot:TRINITY_DN33769_c0_g1_i1.p1 TRINITY_DN33769_c0_g1~~TRINITY_DN33769_c0_g1_i1.p1  ORF type:complete len:141 (-),score=34.71 TRINITY_DN33769_c0_g1_i1:48-470(-)